MSARFLLHRGEGPPERLPRLGPGRSILGRRLDADVYLWDPGVSRTHAFLMARGDTHELTVRSARGATINGETVAQGQRVTLTDGDEVVFARTRLTYTLDTEVVESKTATAQVLPGLHRSLASVEGKALHVVEASLAGLEGPSAGTTIPLNRMSLTLGGPGSTVRLDDSLPKHAVELAVRGARATITATKSTVKVKRVDATHVDTVLPPYALWPGDILLLRDHQLRVDQDQAAARQIDRFGPLVAVCDAMRKRLGVLRELAAHDHPVLLLGERGTGKHTAAEAMHYASARRDGPFVHFETSFYEDEELDEELLGGSGAMASAAGGTLYLTDAEHLPLKHQRKLFALLRSGSDLRVVLGTTLDARQLRESQLLHPAIVATLLRVDLPPLRRREGALEPLALELLRRDGQTVVRLSQQLLARLRAYPWPGNVDELRNVLRRTGDGSRDLLDLQVQPVGMEVDRANLEALLETHVGRVERMAEDLGVSRASVYRLLKLHGLAAADYR